MSKTRVGEFSERGEVRWKVYGEYAKMSNLLAVAVYAIVLVGAQTAEIGESQQLTCLCAVLRYLWDCKDILMIRQVVVSG